MTVGVAVPTQSVKQTIVYLGARQDLDVVNGMLGRFVVGNIENCFD